MIRPLAVRLRALALATILVAGGVAPVLDALVYHSGALASAGEARLDASGAPATHAQVCLIGNRIGTTGPGLPATTDQRTADAVGRSVHPPTTQWVRSDLTHALPASRAPPTA